MWKLEKSYRTHFGGPGTSGLEKFRMLADQFQQAGGRTAGAPLTAFPLDQCRKTHAQQTGKILLSDAPGLAKLGNGVFIGPCTGLAGNDDRRPGFRQGCPVRQAVLNVQFRAFIQVPRYFLDGVSVSAIAVQFRQGTDKALILVTPPDKPCIRTGKAFYFFLVHGLFDSWFGQSARGLTPPCLLLPRSFCGLA